MDPRRLFEKQPPAEPLITLAAVVRDWRTRYIDPNGVGHKHLDLVIEYTAKASSFEEAADRACRSKNEAGVHWNHQSRVPLTTLLALRDRIIHHKKDIKDRLKLYGDDSFGDIHRYIRTHLAPPGIGPVTAYDVAVRLCAYLKVEPQVVYLHAGPTVGWKTICEGLGALGGPVLWHDTNEKGYIEREDLPASLRSLPMDQVEDLLCAYRHVLQTTVRDFR
jgi:hypothetical protein